MFSEIVKALREIFSLTDGPVDVQAKLAARAKENPEHLDYMNSIVDLLKLLKLDSSPRAREALAKDLGYPGTPDGSAEMNTWLHTQVMHKVAQHGIKL